ncbi:hypothetical protein BDV93DRAFT_524622 [Ceratobasidium sp. AG-I]|nr:hypothetical protein BDV93DRAFT_524622 [Ceratobasidium sp. AG-I]
MQKLLKNCHPPILAKTLSTSLNGITLTNIQALKELLAPLLHAVAHPKQCIRCEKTYDDSQNHDEACPVYCMEPEAFAYFDEVWMKEFDCCAKVIREPDLAPYGHNVCYRTSHTEDLEDLDEDLDGDWSS